ncbi:MAG: DNA-binding protein WhiA [Lachnospiraceae bacterium]
MSTISFSESVKEELVNHVSSARHCQLAELSAYLMEIATVNEKDELLLQTEHTPVLQKTCVLLKKLFHILPAEIIKSSEKGATGRKVISEGGSPCYCISEASDVSRILQGVKWDRNQKTVSTLLLKQSCCKRAYLQGAFMCIGSMSDPAKSYHLEYVCGSQEQAEQIQSLLREFSIDAKLTLRKRYHIVYLKESAAIVELLNIIGAHKALMEMENLRIYKELCNDVNRRCNCDTANINKTLRAAEKQIADIKFLKETVGLANLPENLREIAQVRLDNPAISLQDLGELLDPPVGKSGVNHRLRKLSEMAEEQRNK